MRATGSASAFGAIERHYLEGRESPLPNALVALASALGAYKSAGSVALVLVGWITAAVADFLGPFGGDVEARVRFYLVLGVVGIGLSTTQIYAAAKSKLELLRPLAGLLVALDLIAIVIALRARAVLGSATVATLWIIATTANAVLQFTVFNWSRRI